MSRLVAAWKEFWKSINWMGDAANGAEKLVKAIFFWLCLLGPAFLGLQEIPKAQEWKELTAFLGPYANYAIFLSVFTIVYLVWNVAIAWHKTAGPIIWIGNIETDDCVRFFEFRLMNRGEGEVVAHAYATDVRDSRGKRIPMIDSQIELHCRGNSKTDQIRLFGGKHVMIAILQVAPNQASKVLCLVAPHEDRRIFTVIPLPSDQKILLSIRIDFHDEKGEKFLKATTKRLAIIPGSDRSKSMPYRVRSARWLLD